MINSFPAEFRELDPNLPTIAALAAAEIDDLLSNRAPHLDNVSAVAHLLRASFQTSQQHPENGIKQLLDPVSADVFTRTLRDANNTNLRSFEDLAKASLELASNMTAVGGHADRGLLTELKNFCLALSRYALSSKEHMDDFPIYPEYTR